MVVSAAVAVTAVLLALVAVVVAAARMALLLLVMVVVVEEVVDSIVRVETVADPIRTRGKARAKSLLSYVSRSSPTLHTHSLNHPPSLCSSFSPHLFDVAPHSFYECA